MTITPIEDIAFDDAATFAMGEAFDHACKSLRNIGSTGTVRETIATRIIEAAKNGERDPARLHEEALKALASTIISVGRDPPVPTYALVTHAA